MPEATWKVSGEIVTRIGGISVTVICRLAVRPSISATMDADPTASETTTPFVETEATVGFKEIQLATRPGSA